MNDFLEEKLRGLASAGRLRRFQPLSARNGCSIRFMGREMLNLSSNDYLGLGGDQQLHRDFYAQISERNLLDDFGLGSVSSRLLTGDSDRSHQLEELIARSYNKEACLLFNSGYHANIGILPALFGKKDLILADKLNHASINDGMRLCSAHFKRYRHCDYQHLEWLLEKYRGDYNRAVIVSESVFSMDGDVVDLARLIEVKKQYNCQLYIDEAHSIGLYGKKGLGIAEQQGHIDDIDLLVGTFGKALASVGAFVLAKKVMVDYLINTSRSLIFTTALPPVVINWNNFIFKQLPDFGNKRDRLKEISDKLRKELAAEGLSTAGSTNIVPVLIGQDSLAISLAEKMQDSGYLIFAVRPPTVPEGTSRFRLSLTAGMCWEDLQSLASKITAISGSATRRDRQ